MIWLFYIEISGRVVIDHVEEFGEARLRPKEGVNNVMADENQIDRFKELARELGCDEDEAKFEIALKKLAESDPLPRHEPKKRAPKS